MWPLALEHSAPAPLDEWAATTTDAEGTVASSAIRGLVARVDADDDGMVRAQEAAISVGRRPPAVDWRRWPPPPPTLERSV